MISGKFKILNAVTLQNGLQKYTVEYELGEKGEFEANINHTVIYDETGENKLPFTDKEHWYRVSLNNKNKVIAFQRCGKVNKVKVGDICLAAWLLPPDGGNMDYTEVLVCGFHDSFVWINHQGENMVFDNSQIDLKPLPTEEEKLVDEAMSHLKSDLYEDICRDLIKAGYRKVKPISYNIFVNCYGNNNAHLGDMFSNLKRNGFIIVKGDAK